MTKSFEDLVKRTTNKSARERVARRTRALISEMLLSELRQQRGKSQSQLADALGIKQPSLSKLEKQGDMQVSTLQRIVTALGGELEVVAKFPSGTIKISQFSRRRGHGPSKTAANKSYKRG